MGKVQKLLLLVLLACFAAPLPAQINVAYIPANPLVFEIGASPLFPDRNMIALLGTMTFSSIKNTALFDPAFMEVSTVSSGVSFSGDRFSHFQDGQAEYQAGSFSFRIVAVASLVGGVVTKKDITSSPGTPMLTQSSGNQLDKILDIKLYLVSWESHMDQKARLGSSYQLTSNNLGTFNIASAKSGSGFYNGFNYASVNDQIVPSNGSAPYPGQMFSYAPISSIPYGTLQKPDFQLSILDENSFTITDAYGGLSTRIARAKIFLSNASPNQSYGIDITYTNRANSTNFSLHLDNNQNLYAIPYTLIFNGREVEGGKPIRWSNLVPNANYKDISITKVNALRAEMAPAGDYFDTITVTITPIDTL
ncbi:hypothetical protein SDC9_99313 [bioreactor metagenome]|uniref:Uncharacterized protein n=1 Tax=bioreactor metagenome TaxID=1076179 RepID=A0A645ANX5_9ZZZZ